MEKVSRVNGINENNQIHLCGLVVEEPKFLYETIANEKIFEFEIETVRSSGNIDKLICLIPEVFTKGIQKGEMLSIVGEIRTRNVGDAERKHLEIRVFVIKEPTKCEDTEQANDIVLKGFVCKKPVYRTTVLGREIADLLLAVNRPYGKSDYIPCICWGRNAVLMQDYEVGTKLELRGRLQSREYQKRIGDDVEDRVAFEASISSVKQI